MLITENLRKWLIAEKLVKEDASDDDCRKAVADAFVSGKLTPVKFAELSTEEKEKEVNQFDAKMDAIADRLSKLTEVLTKEKEPEKEKEKEPEKEEEKEKEPEKKVAPMSTLTKMVTSMGGTPTEVDGKKIDIRVKEAAAMYDTKKTAMMYPSETKAGRPHPQAGRQVFNYDDHGQALDTASDQDKAIAGAYAKWQCQASLKNGSTYLAFQALPQHDKELLLYAMENKEWNGSTEALNSDHANIVHRRLTPGEQKDLIDDATSGGIEAVPVVFDAQVIEAPLLYGELFPEVNKIPIDRGRFVEGVATRVVTGGWGGVDATPIALYDTDTIAYVSAFDTTIYRWEGAVRIGLDFLSDTPIDFGAHFTRQYGERLLQDLDDVIADGDGATQPEGIVLSGATAVAWLGVTSIGNYESLRFSIPKNELGPAFKSSAVFCGTETSYQRAKALPVAAADARRLFAFVSTTGGTYDDYALMGRPYKINETLTNEEIWFAVLKRYRMYVRRGLTIRTSTEGDTLIRRNELLISVTARYGGQLERGACAGLVADAPA